MRREGARRPLRLRFSRYGERSRASSGVRVPGKGGFESATLNLRADPARDWKEEGQTRSSPTSTAKSRERKLFQSSCSFKFLSSISTFN